MPLALEKVKNKVHYYPVPVVDALYYFVTKDGYQPQIGRGKYFVSSVKETILTEAEYNIRTGKMPRHVLSEVNALPEPLPGMNFQVLLDVPKALDISLRTLSVEKKDNILYLSLLQDTKRSIVAEDLRNAYVATINIFDNQGKEHTTKVFDISYIDDMDFKLDGSANIALVYVYKFKIRGVRHSA